uniref:Uncharacterized protein n=1 Tax=Salix viminalis TaxID=40686 RepID=A0A6N2MG79_SALVM
MSIRYHRRPLTSFHWLHLCPLLQQNIETSPNPETFSEASRFLNFLWKFPIFCNYSLRRARRLKERPLLEIWFLLLFNCFIVFLRSSCDLNC